MRSEQEIRKALNRYADTVTRLCMLHLHNKQDAEDIFQTVFMKYMHFDGQFENDEHEKAWFIRVTINACKDLHRSFFHSRTVSLDAIKDCISPIHDDYREVLEAVLQLPKKYRQVIYLHYYEDRTVPQIAQLLGKNPNTIYTQLKRAKEMLKKKLGGIADEENHS